jgi:hypothetical protein
MHDCVHKYEDYGEQMARWKYEVFVSGLAERVYHPGVA